MALNGNGKCYTISFEERLPNYVKCDFESLYSTLHFNIDQWPGIDIETKNRIDRLKIIFGIVGWPLSKRNGIRFVVLKEGHPSARQFCIEVTI